MPNSYTAGVQDGTVTDLSQYALLCARAFGALISMRDDRMDAPTPDLIEPGPCYAEALSEATARIDELKRMSPEDIEFASKRFHADALAAWEKRQQDKAEQRARYVAMLEKVRNWSPPTADHEPFKSFMVDQIEKSIEWDCREFPDPEPTTPTPKDWHIEQLVAASRRLAMCEGAHREEVERAESKTKWLTELRSSLDECADKEASK
ncbi:hypothetical protein APY04_0786 [Hyphomicrobium sulfonivorans]|uniref:Uncharacterized protein n=1 Tax=Hyphomicrobium sulfonivorans TaxID=121290 RepID=A0A120CXB7_HYPSL|nr:hypothetical protein [Hyphomicrobium sulfonivorans]KWT70725.1 hypothetical protein APY04_0786 [Hyphomicrobium sulfonivorans]